MPVPPPPRPDPRPSSELLQRGVLDAGFDALAIVQSVRDAEGRLLDFRVIDVNAKSCAMIGRPREAVLGLPLEAAIPQARASGLWDQCATVVITQRPMETTQAVPAADQPERWVRRQLVPVEGEIVAISARDVTDLQREQRAMEQSEERHRRLFENNGAIQLLVDVPTARIVDANPSAEAFYGWPRETLQSMAITDLESIALEQWLAGVSGIEAGSGQRVRREHRVATGTFRLVDAYYGMVAVGTRRLLHLIIQDLTERERAERELWESEQRFRTVIQGMRDGVVVFDEAGAIVLHNPSAERILGLTAEQLQGVHPFDRDWRALHEDGTPWPVDEHPGFVALRTGQPQPRQLMQLYNGTRGATWLSVAADPLYRPGATRPSGAVGVFTDITALKSYEERLRQTQTLEAIAHLAGGMAHDYNNLLTVIRGATGFLRDGIDGDSPFVEDVAAIERATDQAEALTRRLLAMGRRQLLRPESVELNDLLRNELPAIREALPMAVIVQLDLRQGPVLAAIDRRQLLDALHGLIENAVAAMPDGGMLVLSTSMTTRAHPHDPHGDAVQRDYGVLEVGDTGVGMPATIRAHLAAPFFDARPLGLGTEVGRGLGLAAIHGLLHQSEGFIVCEAGPGRGTRVRLFIPLAGSSPG